MSLINDALKRAKEAQQNNPPEPPAVPPLRPVENERSHGPGLGLMLGLILVLLIVATGILLLQWIQLNRKTISATNVAGEVTAPPIAAVKPEARPEPPPTVASPPAVAATPPPAVAAPAPATMEAVQTNVVAATPPPPKPEFKLQGISYRPGRSTALINGRTVKVGDRLGEAHVTAITAESVTVVFAGQTNVLTFGEPY